LNVLASDELFESYEGIKKIVRRLGSLHVEFLAKNWEKVFALVSYNGKKYLIREVDEVENL